MNNLSSEVLILGSGPAGLTAAIYAARSNLKPILVHGLQPGGQMTITTDVENYPGFKDVIQGPWLMEQMQLQAEAVGTKFFYDTITDVDLSKRPFICKGDSGNQYTGKTLIISTGAQARWLNLPSEDKYKGFGVSACATCDGFFFKNKKVAVVGGGNTAVEEALYLTSHAEKVYIIHRKDEFRAEKILQKRVFENSKIQIIWNSTIEEILGTENPNCVNGIKIKNKVNKKIESVDLDGVFIAIGHTPNTNLFKNQLEINKSGYIKTDSDSTKTNIKGVFAAGDVQDSLYRQAVTAAGTGCMAAIEAGKLIAED
ncbi:thioredoxin-disulfide reductase [Alphaproteobacteria bacterium]|nr:thioredoxin-disulfide reductase [Alphaproteobacteria bacterium]